MKCFFLHFRTNGRNRFQKRKQRYEEAISTKKDIEAPSSIQIVSDTINKRGYSVEDKIKRLEALLIRCREQIRKTRPGPAQDAAKARALRVLKQKRKYEVQRDVLHSQTASLDQVAVAREEIKDITFFFFTAFHEKWFKNSEAEPVLCPFFNMRHKLMRDIGPKSWKKDFEGMIKSGNGPVVQPTL